MMCFLALYASGIVASILFASGLAKPAATCDPKQTHFTDPRDGIEYKLISIGDCIWFASNLNYSMPGSVCYDSATINCNQYGRLYSWTAAAKACPDGWRLPTPEEVESIYEMTGSQKIRTLAAPDIWEVKGTSSFDNRSGLSILPAGRIDSFSFYAPTRTTWVDTMAFHQLGAAASFWLMDTTPSHDIIHWHIGSPIGETKSGLHRHRIDPETHMFSIRCVCEN